MKLTQKDLGAYFTPKHIAKKALDILYLNDLNQKIDKLYDLSDKDSISNIYNEISTKTFLDPTCGDGQLLIAAYEQQLEIEKKIQRYLNINEPTRISKHNFYGMEINEQYVIEARKHFPDENIIVCNTLNVKWDEVFNSKSFDYVIMNPPYGHIHNSKLFKEFVPIILSDIKKKYRSPINYALLFVIKLAEYLSTHPTTDSVNIVQENLNYMLTNPRILKHYFEKYNLKISSCLKNIIWDAIRKDTAGIIINIFQLSKKERPIKLINNKPVEKITTHLTDYQLIFDGDDNLWRNQLQVDFKFYGYHKTTKALYYVSPLDANSFISDNKDLPYEPAFWNIRDVYLDKKNDHCGILVENPKNKDDERLKLQPYVVTKLTKCIIAPSAISPAYIYYPIRFVKNDFPYILRSDYNVFYSKDYSIDSLYYTYTMISTRIFFEYIKSMFVKHESMMYIYNGAYKRFFWLNNKEYFNEIVDYGRKIVELKNNYYNNGWCMAELHKHPPKDLVLLMDEVSERIENIYSPNKKLKDVKDIIECIGEHWMEYLRSNPSGDDLLVNNNKLILKF